jgi:hypothetical protein
VAGDRPRIVAVRRDDTPQYGPREALVERFERCAEPWPSRKRTASSTAANRRSVAPTNPGKRMRRPGSSPEFR